MEQNIKWNEKLFQIAGKYWRCKLDNGRSHDNGDNSDASAMASILATMVSLQNPVSKEQLDNFEKYLVEEVHKALEKYPDMNSIDMYSDYAPGWILGEAAKRAGINQSRFPWKTGLFIRPNVILESQTYARRKFCDKIIYCNRDFIKSQIDDYIKTIQSVTDETDGFMGSKEDRDNYVKELSDTVSNLQNLSMCLVNNEYIREDVRKVMEERW